MRVRVRASSTNVTLTHPLLLLPLLFPLLLPLSLPLLTLPTAELLALAPAPAAASAMAAFSDSSLTPACPAARRIAVAVSPEAPCGVIQAHSSHGHSSHGHFSHGHFSHGHSSHGHFSHGHSSHGHSSKGHSSHGKRKVLNRHPPGVQQQQGSSGRAQHSWCMRPCCLA